MLEIEAGPDTIPTGTVANGYVPCHYQAPSAGVYDVAFLGPNGFSDDTDGNVVAHLVGVISATRITVSTTVPELL